MFLFSVVKCTSVFRMLFDKVSSKIVSLIIFNLNVNWKEFDILSVLKHEYYIGYLFKVNKIEMLSWSAVCCPSCEVISAGETVKDVFEAESVTDALTSFRALTFPQLSSLNCQ